MTHTVVNRHLAIAAVLLFAAGGVNLAGQQSPLADLVPAATAMPLSYRLTPGDVVDLKFAYNPELNDTVTLRPDGCISLQMIGDVHAQKLTPLELASRRRTMREVSRRPTASVIVRRFAAQRPTSAAKSSCRAPWNFAAA